MEPRLMTTEHRLIVALCKSQLEAVREIEKPIIDRLFEIGAPPDAELAEMFEGVANLYMDVSEAITSAVLAARREGHALHLQTAFPEKLAS
jgi:hypothetical protein